MTFITGPKEKKARSLGANLQVKAERSLSQKSAMVRRAYRPGMHGKRRRMLSEYGTQLAEKQKIRFSYGLEEKKMKRYVDAAISAKKVSAPEALVRELESRLDNVVFRSGFAQSRSIARIMVSHGHINVNGRRVDVPSKQVSVGDVVSIREGSRQNKLTGRVSESLKKYAAPSWLAMDPEKFTAKMKAHPSMEEVGIEYDIPLVLEFYSR